MTYICCYPFESILQTSFLIIIFSMKLHFHHKGSLQPFLSPEWGKVERWAMGYDVLALQKLMLKSEKELNETYIAVQCIATLFTLFYHKTRSKTFHFT